MLRRLSPLLLPLVALAGCGLTEDLASMDGIVTDPQGRPVSGAVVRVYPFSRNLEYFSAEEVTGNRLNPDSYRARVSIEKLDATRFGGITTEKALGFQTLQMAMDGRT